MTESVAPGNPTKNRLLPQIKTVADLPSADTRRWVPRRKAVIVDAVRQGVVSLEEVCRRYQLSAAEFPSWQRAIATHGVPGLRVTRLQIYRNPPPARPTQRTCKAPYS
jgi:transposase-like protein